MAEVKIRKAKRDDLNKIRELNLLLFKEDYQRDQTFNLDWTFSKDGETFYKEMVTKSDSCALVAESKGEIVGYIVGNLKKEQIRVKSKYAELEDMLVLPKFRNQGIGSKLLEEFISWCKQKGISCLSAKVTVKNQQAVKFYKERGFKDYILTLERRLK
jgi:ribosomal protein S18 acetylase RimI-like enzyme